MIFVTRMNDKRSAAFLPVNQLSPETRKPN